MNMAVVANPESNDSVDKQVIEFLKDMVIYLENRISIVDNKASILIGVQGLYFGVLTYIVSEFFLTTCQSSVRVASYVVLGIAFAVFVATMLLLLLTIRPARWILGPNVPFVRMEVKNYVIWFDNDFPTTPDSYSRRIDALDLLQIRRNYEKVHFISLQLVRNKYRFYRWAAVGMKLLVLCSAVGMVVLVALKWRT